MNRTLQTRESLERRRLIIEADLVSKLEARDYHGVADAAMDLREIDARVALLEDGLHVPGLGKGICEGCRQEQWVAYNIMIDKTVCLACSTRLMTASLQSPNGDGLTLDAPHPGIPDLEI